MVDFSQVIVHLDGKPLTVKTGEDERGNDIIVEMTLGRLAANALLTAWQGEGHVSGTDQIQRFMLATKVHDGGEVKLSADERDLIKKRIEKVCAMLPIAVARAWLALDPDCGQ